MTVRDRYVWSRRVNGSLHPFTLWCYAVACPWKVPLLPFKVFDLAVFAVVGTVGLRSRVVACLLYRVWRPRRV